MAGTMLFGTLFLRLFGRIRLLKHCVNLLHKSGLKTKREKVNLQNTVLKRFFWSKGPPEHSSEEVKEGKQPPEHSSEEVFCCFEFSKQTCCESPPPRPLPLCRRPGEVAVLLVLVLGSVPFQLVLLVFPVHVCNGHFSCTLPKLYRLKNSAALTFWSLTGAWTRRVLALQLG